MRAREMWSGESRSWEPWKRRIDASRVNADEVLVLLARAKELVRV